MALWVCNLSTHVQEPGSILHNLLTVFTKEMTQFDVRHVSVHLLFVRKIQLRSSAFRSVVLCPSLSTRQYSCIRVLNISCGRVTQICVYALQLWKTGDAHLRF